MTAFHRQSERLTISETRAIIDAMRRLEETQERLLFCVNALGQLAGVVNDGDLRRALLAGRALEDPVSTCMTRSPVAVSKYAPATAALDQLSWRIQILPVVDEHHRLVGYYSLQQKLSQAPHVRAGRVVVIGLGYVGLTLALSLASAGMSVLGIERRRDLVETLSRRQPPFFEDGLQALLEREIDRNLTVHEELGDLAGDIYIVTVGTPVDKETKRPILEHVRSAAGAVGRSLRRGNLVIMRSTLPVGCSREYVLPILERESGLKGGEDFAFVFAPERTIEGRALVELRRNPQIIGGLDVKSVDVATQFFNVLSPSVVEVDSLEAAEICKLMDNCYRDHVFAFANQFVGLSETLGLDLNRLIMAANFGYERNRIPVPSPGVGGPCLSKDPYILATVFRERGFDPALIVSARAANETGPRHVLAKLEQLLRRAGKTLDCAVVTVVGLAFKGEPETDDLRDSPALEVVEGLRGAGRLRAHDPVVQPHVLRALDLDPVDVPGAFAGSDAVVILNNHRSYANWNLSVLLPSMNHPAVVIDTWYNFDPRQLRSVRGIIYGGLGND